MRRVLLIALTLSLLPWMGPALWAVDCSDILGNEVSPCGFQNAAEVAAWDSGAGAAAFAAGLGQDGGALEGAPDDFGALGFVWSRRSPCFPVTAGEVFSLGYAARLVSGPAPSCSAGYQQWADAACTVGNGGAVSLNQRVVSSSGYVSVLGRTTAVAGTAAISLIMDCRSPRDFEVRVDNAFAVPVATEACVRNDSRACLHAGRFEVEVGWQTDDDSGDAEVMEFGGQRAENDESVFWWFFGPQNFEMGVKVLEACEASLGDKYWVFMSGLTDQGWTVRVRDTYTDAVSTYENPVGHVSETFTDTAAFDCP